MTDTPETRWPVGWGLLLALIVSAAIWAGAYAFSPWLALAMALVAVAVVVAGGLVS